jgi:site-specific recombinase XerD
MCHLLLLMAHLSRWLDEERLDPGALTAPRVEEFFVVRRASGYSMYRSPAALTPLLDYLGSVGVVVPCVMAEPTPVDVLIERFENYLTGERGLALSTVRGYVRAIRPLLAGLTRGDRLNVGQLTAGDVTGFMLEVAREQRPGKAQTTATALRSLLGFLHVKGLVASSLVGAVPSVASWRLAPLPRGLEPDEVNRLLAACDRRTTAGRRDFAILLLLVRLGLRAGEVAGLGLDDINWRVGEIVVFGKGDRLERLPLPNDAGRAVVGYLKRGRSATAQGRTVFVRLKAPHRQLTSEAVSKVVFSAGRRAGLATVRAHRLRHTVATQTLAAGGSLVEIGQLLRHRKVLTTAIYAKVDRAALKGLARPWPGGGAS